MPKGKKFNAAEKHFEEKHVEYRKKIRELEQANKVLHKKFATILMNWKSYKRKMNI